MTGIDGKKELNNRAFWYPKCDAEKLNENYEKTMYFYLTEGVFKPFVDFVKTSESDDSLPTLMLCFRSNKDSVTIYYNNHIVWDLRITKTGPEVYISANHARYSENWSEIFSSVVKDKEKLNELNNRLEKLQKKNINKENSKKAIDIGTVSFSADKLSKDYPEESFPYLKKMIDDYFDVDKIYDFFSKRNAYKGYNRHNNKYIEGKRDLTEKKRQQEFYIANNKFKDGYFVYDMEYMHEYGNKEEKDKHLHDMGVNKANQTDCLAIKYDNQGKPQKLAFVEIKSLKDSMKESDTEGSGLKAHMINMDRYITNKEHSSDYMQIRIKEAKDILTLYHKLELRGVSKDICEADFSKLEKPGNQEIVLVYTDSAKEYIEGTNGKKWLKKTLKDYRDKSTYKVWKCIRKKELVFSFEEQRFDY